MCLIAIFVPPFLLVVGALPFWEQLRPSVRTQAALAGVNAADAGLPLAALYHPVWTSAAYKPEDFGLALIALVALMFWRLPPWLVVNQRWHAVSHAAWLGEERLSAIATGAIRTTSATNL